MQIYRSPRALAVVLIASLIGGCGTSAFKVEPWTVTSSSTTPSTVDKYLRDQIGTYDRMIGELEAGKGLLEIPIIPAAVIGATGVALGARPDLAIVMAGGSAGLSAGSAYLRPRERLGFVVQARAAAVCINREYLEQVLLAQSLGLLAPRNEPFVPLTPAEINQLKPEELHKYNLELQTRPDTFARRAAEGQLMLLATDAANDFPEIAPQVAGVGKVAVMAADDVVTRLKTRLAAVGTTPDYGAIVTDLRQRFDDAHTRTNQAQTNRSVMFAANSLTAVRVTDADIKQLAEYSARVAECVAKFP
ncbi:MAG: hypothetical protein ABI810_04200 [Sphingomonas bacterium]